MTPPEFSMERPRYESRFGLKVPLINDVKQHADELERTTVQIATRYAPHAADKSFKYVRHLPEELRRRIASEGPRLGVTPPEGNILTIRGIEAVNFLTQVGIDEKLEQWLKAHPDYARVLGPIPFDPKDPGFCQHPAYSLFGIGRSIAYGATGQDFSNERAFFTEFLYFALLVAYGDIRGLENHKWIVKNVEILAPNRIGVDQKLRRAYKELVALQKH